MYGYKTSQGMCCSAGTAWVWWSASTWEPTSHSGEQEDPLFKPTIMGLEDMVMHLVQPIMAKRQDQKQDDTVLWWGTGSPRPDLQHRQ